MAEMTSVPIEMPVETPAATHGFFIDGHWSDDGDVVEVRSPFDGAVVGASLRGGGNMPRRPLPLR